MHVIPHLGAASGRAILNEIAYMPEDSGPALVVTSSGSYGLCKHYPEIEEAFEKLGIDVFKIDGIFKRDWEKNIFATQFISEKCRRNKIQVINSYSGVCSIVCSFVAKELGIPHVATCIGLGSSEKEEWMKKMDSYCYAKADMIVAISHGVACELYALGVPAEKIVVNYRGIEVSESLASSSLNQQKGKLLIFSAGVLDKRKNHRNVIKAVSMMALDSVELHIYGDGPERGPLEKLVSELNLDSNVIFHGWVKNVHNVFCSFDIFVLTPLSEALGKVFLEAMAAGVPVVGSAVGGIPEIIEDGEMGFLVSPNSPEKLRSKLQILVDDPSLRSKFGLVARQFARDRFSFNREFEKKFDIYRQLVDV